VSKEKSKALPDIEILISMLRQMYEIRSFEVALYHVFMTEKMPGTMHQANGMEAVSVGVGHAIGSEDAMTSTHRGHGHAIAKGVSLKAIMAEMYAKQSGTSAGLGGSMHIFDTSNGFLGTTGIVGSGIPIAVGAGLAAKLEGKGQVSVAFFGDGASNQGVVHEAMNLAAVWELPVLFVCENNQYAVSMPIENAVAIDHISERASAYGIPGKTVDGNDVLAVYKATKHAVGRAQKGRGASLIECVTYRHKGHSRFEPAAYRPDGELDSWLDKDPIKRFRKLLDDQGVYSFSESDRLKSEVDQRVQEAIEFAKQSPDASLEQAKNLVFALDNEVL
jgi:acetoin:2,6-dichlorophenolindophenol oxidoreductase subunit alpha